MTVDSYRFISGITKRMIKSWIGLERPRSIPWTPLAKPLKECTVSLISTAGIALKTDKPFDQEGERRNPWWGDPSYRILPAGATSQDVRVYHQHIDPSYAEQDLNCLFPLQRLEELAQAREIGRSAPKHTIRSWATSCGPSNSWQTACRRSSATSRRITPTSSCSYPPDRSAAGPLDWCSARSKQLASPPSPFRPCPC